MNAFKILNSEGTPIPINTLDKEVCELIGNESDKKHYCILGKREDYPAGMGGSFQFHSNTTNWYDSIGWMIASEGKSFQDIIDYYANVMADHIGQTDEDGTIITLEKIYPYHLKVLNTWMAKGYQPVQIIQ